MNAQWMTGGIVKYNRYSATIVNTVLVIDENRLVRNQPSTPTVITGGGRSASRSNVRFAVDRAMGSALYQGGFLVVPVHEHRNQQADGKVYRHRHENDFHRLAGLVQRGAGPYRHQVGVADRGR